MLIHLTWQFTFWWPHINHDIIRELEDNELVIDVVQKPIAIDSLMAKVAQGVGTQDIL
jgi:hypothetical protein